MKYDSERALSPVEWNFIALQILSCEYRIQSMLF